MVAHVCHACTKCKIRTPFSCHFGHLHIVQTLAGGIDGQVVVHQLLHIFSALRRRLAVPLDKQRRRGTLVLEAHQWPREPIVYAHYITLCN